MRTYTDTPKYLFSGFHVRLVFQALNEISEGEGDVEYEEEELAGGSLLR